MILIYALVGSIVIGYLLGGRLSHYLHMPLRGLLFPILSFGIEAFAPQFEQWAPWPAASWLWAFVCVQYLLSFCFIYLNRSRKPMLVLGLGTALNALVIASHGFRMPVSPLVYRYEELLPFVARIESGELLEYVLVNWNAPLWWLGDTVPILIGAPGLASIGDLLIGVGMGWLMVQLMRQKPKQDSTQDGASVQAPTKDGQSLR